MNKILYHKKIHLVNKKKLLYIFIAKTVDCFDKRWGEFFTETFDVAVYGTVIQIGVLGIGGLDELLAGKHLVFVFYEGF